VPDILAKAQVYALDMGALLAGPSIAAIFEQRLKAVLKQLTDNPNAILFIDEIHTLIGAGAASGGTLDASNLLKPALSTGQLKCIGATTYTESAAFSKKTTRSPPLPEDRRTRAFHRRDGGDPARTQVALRDPPRRQVHTVGAYHRGGTVARYINDRHLPDKAIDVIDEAGAAQKILPKSKQRKVISKHEIEEIIAKIGAYPAEVGVE